MSDAHQSHGTLLQLSDGGSPAEWINIAELKAIGGPAFQRDSVDVTHLNSPGQCREFLAALCSSGDVTFSGNYVPGGGGSHDQLLTHFQAAAASAMKSFRILWPSKLDRELTFTVDTGNNDLDIAAHAIGTPQECMVSNSGGALPTSSPQIDALTMYWAAEVNSGTIALYTTEADARADTNRITFSSTGSGTHTLHSQQTVEFTAMVSDFTPTAQAPDELRLSGTLTISGEVTERKTP